MSPKTLTIREIFDTGSILINICSLFRLDVTVGFNAVSYVTTETEGHVTICVDVLNPAAEGALRPFTVGLIPEPGVPKSSNCFITISEILVI